jgi:DNA-binding NarL/FixJ family response regulator
MSVRVASVDGSEATLEVLRSTREPHRAREQSVDLAESADQSFPGSHWGLTARESQVLVLLASGLNNRAIANVLAVGENDVRAQVRSIFCKLGVTSKSQAVACARADASFAAPTCSSCLAADASVPRGHSR